MSLRSFTAPYRRSLIGDGVGSGANLEVEWVRTYGDLSYGMLNGIYRLDRTVDGNLVLAHLFSHAAPPSCAGTADANDDGTIDIADVIRDLTFLFGSGGALPEPSGTCGIDPTPDDLDCRSYTPCTQ